MIFHVIGIGNKKANFTAHQLKIITKTKVFSGGKRHFKLVEAQLPDHYRWITITAPLRRVFENYEKASSAIVVFVSGDPLFYGFSNTLKERYPTASIHNYPYLSAIQLLANKTNTTINHIQTISVHGREWSALDSAVIRQLPLVGILTDAEKTPKQIAIRLLDFGYDNYEMVVGEDLEGEREQIQYLTLKEASSINFHELNCILLKKRTQRLVAFGIKDTMFKGLDGRPNMITKMPIRLITLHLLEILQIKVLWDIGFCTGAVSIEAKLKNPELTIIAFEKREESEALMRHNQRRFGTPGIDVVMGDFFHHDVTHFPQPEAVFIGGHGGRLEELIARLRHVAPHTILVINAVQQRSSDIFIRSCKEVGFSLKENINIALDLHNPIRLLKAVKE